MRQIAVKILPETHAALVALKGAEGRSHVEIMRRAVESYYRDSQDVALHGSSWAALLKECRPSQDAARTRVDE